MFILLVLPDPILLFPWLLLVYAGMSLVTFAVYWRDKYRANTGGRRTRERTLHVLELLGGWPGAFLAHRVLRHKNRKASFLCVYWIIVVLHLILWGWWLKSLVFGSG
jgi:uncharacterized membrane protein YsdA (DUF1294 family)